MSNDADELQNDERLFAECGEAWARLRAQVARVIIGQDEVVEQLVTALFAGGHCLLVGVPGLAKTLLVSTVARCLRLSFSRVQFTPDLMPGDITGTEVLEEDAVAGKRVFRFIRGPVFANVVLADEINRTPPKTQAALLQAMQEGYVTAGGEDHQLEPPFFVLATQNPIELEGTYPLPEAQLDRFMFDVRVGYPSVEEELRIVDTTTSAPPPDPEPVLDAAAILRIQRFVRRVPVDDRVLRYAVALVRASREPGHPGVGEYLAWGAGPRAAQYLVLAAKTRSLLHGQPTPDAADVRAVALPVLRHRLVTNFRAEADGVSTDDLARRLLESVPE